MWVATPDEARSPQLVERVIVRHCQATGQEPDAPLTDEGREQAQKLACFFSGIEVDQIISSPYIRAVETIRPVANRLNLPIQLDHRLKERVLCGNLLPDWSNRLQETFEDLDLCLEGGESSRMAMNRAVSVVEEILHTNRVSTIIVSHGNLISLLLKHFDGQIGFEDWKRMTNPDVFKLTIHNREKKIERIWREGKNHRDS